MTEHPSSPHSPPRWRRRLLLGVLALVALWGLVSYVLAPLGWEWYARRHPALEDLPRVTHTGSGIPGDALNVALVGTEKEVVAGLLAAKWYPADPLTLKSCLLIAVDTVFHRSYDQAPVSNLYLWGRKEDLAFEQPVGDDPRRRHHVRLWRSDRLDADGRPFWLGAATFDRRVGFSHTTGQITHHIGPDIDAERAHVLDTLEKAGVLAEVYWVPGFQQREGRNGGGDPYFSDGRLGVGVLAGGEAVTGERTSPGR